ncbi:hypothetical protein HDA40_004162 [Hamadaea flava]|uniref:Uncharacterized protein n=1 Tax=Hamadaea flava TaxID=1742688 RepID=A0ABV8LGX7_9ACTN|nr:hypothetical protein [Hamadaea flava]MCP2325655.1 hypothetical protein [Hamadaea flava]
MPDFDYDGPAGPSAFRRHVAPVAVRLEGSEQAVTNAVAVLREVFTVAYESSLFRNDDGSTHLDLTLSRDYPYSGGSK